MKFSSFGYSISVDNVVGTPREVRLGARDRARLLVVDCKTGFKRHMDVCDLADVLEEGDLVVLNNSKRIPGVLKARNSRGGKVELTFVDFIDEQRGICKIFPLQDIREGDTIATSNGAELVVTALEQGAHKLAEVTTKNIGIKELLKSEGTPIYSFFYDKLWNIEHLNPFYASEEGSVESPLAGLHFTEGLVKSLTEKGVQIAFVTLHAAGSWLPPTSDLIEEHHMIPERFCVSDASAAAINATHQAGKRVIACGSTVLKAIESADSMHSELRPTNGTTNKFIKPGTVFKYVDGYFTNFHQHHSSLMVLDASFAGQENARDSYSEAAIHGYKFFEFGDAVLYLAASQAAN